MIMDQSESLPDRWVVVSLRRESGAYHIMASDIERVLTAVEDYLASSKPKLIELTHVSGFRVYVSSADISAVEEITSEQWEKNILRDAEMRAKRKSLIGYDDGD